MFKAVQSKNWRENNKEYSKMYYETNKEVLKEHYHKNKDKILENQKIYKENNKDKLSEYRKQKFTCECGSIYSYTSKSEHFKTKKHFQFIESKKQLIE